jgi:hypothetical protein
MELNKLIEKLKEIFSGFVHEQETLITQNADEEAISTELVVYMKREFPWEYDINGLYAQRWLDGNLIRKKVEFLVEWLPENKKPKGEPVPEKTVRELVPDVIFHDLNSDRHNFLAIEMKKSTNKDKEARKWDRAKLKALTANMRYSYGVFAEFATGEEYDPEHPFKFEVFVDGTLVHEE